jgi:dTDP-4-amino-4,6-dideoxygalactose transaminase
MQEQKVLFLNLAREYRELAPELDAAYTRVMNSGQYILGAELAAFEQEYAQYCDSKRAIGFANYLDALSSILKAWELNEGDEIIMPAHNCTEASLAAIHAAAKPVFVDIGENTFNIDVSKISAAINDRTKVIMLSHLYGQMADMDPILELARKYNLKVLEDAAQAQGALYKSKKCGVHSNAAVFSLYPTMNLGGYAYGAMITSNDNKLCDQLSLQHHYRLDELQAALLRVKLKRLDHWNQKRRDLARLYLKEFHNIAPIVLPNEPEWSQSAWQAFVIRVPGREALIEHLEKNGIGYRIHYPSPACQNHAASKIPITERVCKEVLSLPLSPYHSELEIKKVIAVIKEFYEQ